jgi:hypothetical protein
MDGSHTISRCETDGKRGCSWLVSILVFEWYSMFDDDAGRNSDK